MKYKFGDIVLVPFPFTDGINYKIRPALVIMDSNDGDIILLRITSSITYNNENDVELLNWQTANLLKPSVVRLHKIISYQSSLVKKYLGHLSKSDKQNLATVFLYHYKKALEVE